MDDWLRSLTWASQHLAHEEESNLHDKGQEHQSDENQLQQLVPVPKRRKPFQHEQTE